MGSPYETDVNGDVDVFPAAVGREYRAFKHEPKCQTGPVGERQSGRPKI
jgi:hypothetical protein